MKNLFLLFFLIALANLGNAVQPSEVLSDTVLEERARSISQGLRCLQCRNESIDESNAGIAKDLRLLVRARLVAGESDTEVIDYIVVRYGEYVLLRPNGLGINLVLWLAGPLLFLLALAGLLTVQRRSTSGTKTKVLSKAEEKEIEKILTS